jgi:hypothetical protein
MSAPFELLTLRLHTILALKLRRRSAFNLSFSKSELLYAKGPFVSFHFEKLESYYWNRLFFLECDIPSLSKVII